MLQGGGKDLVNHTYKSNLNQVMHFSSDQAKTNYQSRSIIK